MKQDTIIRRARDTHQGSAVRSDSIIRSDADREWLRAALHDGLGQLLTSISFLAGSLRQKLAAQELPEANEAAEILSLTGRAISETQALVQGETNSRQTGASRPN